MRTLETTIYTFDELTTESARERARDWYREIYAHEAWWDCVYEDAVRIGSLLGIEIAPSGNHGYELYFSGLDGNGSVYFRGTYSYRKGALKAVLSECPQDTELHALARALQDLQRRHFYHLVASISLCGRDGMEVDAFGKTGRRPYESAFRQELSQRIHDFASWIKSNLNREYEWMMSEECVDESILANEYTFTEDGTRAG